MAPQIEDLYGKVNFTGINIDESCHKKNTPLGFPTRYDTNRAVQPQIVSRGLKFRIYKVEGVFLYYLFRE